MLRGREEPRRGPGELETPAAVRATGHTLNAPGRAPCPPGAHAPMLAGPVRSGYAGRHERGHAHPVRHRAGRPLGRGATLAAGLRRAAPTRGPETGPRTARPDPASDRTGARGVPAPGRWGPGAALEQPRPL